MKLFVAASVLDLTLPFGCTPAWWQLLKGLHENGAEIVASAYHGPAIESPWWRAAGNPCLSLGNTYARLRSVRRMLPSLRSVKKPAKEGGKGRGLEQWLVKNLVTPRWKRHVEQVLAKEKNVDAVLILNLPLNHIVGLASFIRKRFGVPVVYFDGDLPASLPSFGGFASGFNIYHGADLTEYDMLLSNSQGSLEPLRQLGARRAETLWWGADPGVFRPQPVEQDIDVFFYGLGAEYRADWLRDMIAIPSQKLPHLRFVVAGAKLDLDLGRAERVGVIPPSQLNHWAARARINLNVARRAHASVYASATTRIFELAAMEQCIVSNPLEGIAEWFEPGKEVAVVHSAEEATATIARLMEQPEERRRLASNARARLLRQHTYAQRAQRLLGLLQELKPSAATAYERESSQPNEPRSVPT